MNDVTRERLWRKLQVLPDDQLYQVLDFIEFLESKYAPGKAPEPTGLQRFAERLEDRLRMRSLAPQYIRGAVGMFGAARKMVETSREVVNGVVEAGLGVVDGVVETGRDLLAEEKPAAPSSGAAAALPRPTSPSSPPSAGPRPAAHGPTSGSATPPAGSGPAGSPPSQPGKPAPPERDGEG